MRKKKKVRVLVLDDSEFFCEMITMHLQKDDGIEIAGVTTDAMSAFKMAEELKPDVITVDIQMPIMDGIEFTRRLVPKTPIPIIILSAVDSRVFEAMEAGAVDFVLKPDPNDIGATSFMTELLVKIRIAAASRVHWDQAAGEQKEKSRPERKKTVFSAVPQSADIETTGVVAIGASTGGTEALMQILKKLPDTFPPVLIAQHIPETFSTMFAQRADTQSNLLVKEAEDGEDIVSGTVYVAPGGAQMYVECVMNRCRIRCEYDVKHNGYAPCIDVLFNSVSQIYGSKAIGVILTGMGKDGAQGLLSMRAAGAYTIGQDEESSVIYGMPAVAWQIGAVQKQLPLGEISDELINRLRK